MIRMLNDEYAKTLFEMYLDSISSARGKARKSGLPKLDGDGNALRELELPEAGLQFSAEKYYGSIRTFDDGEFLVLYLIIAGEGEGLYTAIKVSPFVEFITRAHLEFAASAGNYIAELDNAFSILAGEVDQSVVIDEVDPFTFMQLESAWTAVGKDFTGLPVLRGSLNRWQYQFVAKEHEATTWFRSRGYGPAAQTGIWVPQIELGQPESGKKIAASLDMRPPQRSRRDRNVAMMEYREVMPEARYRESREDLEELYSELKQEKQEIEARMEHVAEKLRNLDEDYRLETSPRGEVVLRPGSRWRGKPVKIYSDDYLVFKGEMPPELLLTNSGRAPRRDWDRVLKLQIVPL